MTQGRPRVKLADTPAEWAGAVAVRLAVFVDEQHFPLTTEMDEHDRSAVHAIAILAVPVGLSPPEGTPRSIQHAVAGTAAEMERRDHDAQWRSREAGQCSYRARSVRKGRRGSAPRSRAACSTG